MWTSELQIPLSVFSGSIASVYFSVLLLLFPFEGFGLVPPLFVIIFPLF